jgi:hypothetical protein
MAEKKTDFFEFKAGERVLFSPLDWGLGHATRCMPLIKSWIELGCIVTIAADGPHAEVIREAFPGVRILSWPGYRVRLASNPRIFSWYFVAQFPRLIRRMFAEQRSMLRLMKQEKFDYIVSDNRPGFFHPEITSIYITHQLSVRTGYRWLDSIASWMHRKLMSRFQTCWVPDWEGERALAGDLSNPKTKPSFAIQYLGPLSRMESSAPEKKYRFVAVISGPEPQRSLLEQILLPWLEKQNGPTALVRGLPGMNGLAITSTCVEIFNHLPAHHLAMLMQQSEWVIARSGYSTIMDLVQLKQQAILIPTPGQAEQIYLADHLKSHSLFQMIKQEQWSAFNPEVLTQ